MPVSVHGGLSGGVDEDIVTPKIFCQTSPSFSRHIGFCVRCRNRWIGVVCRGFIIAVISDFSMTNELSRIALVFIDGRFASARVASTGVVQSWPVMARPA